MNKDVAEIIDLVGRMNGGMRCPGHTKPGEVCNMCYRPPKEKRKEVDKACASCGFFEGDVVTDDGDHVEGAGCCCPYECKDYSQWVKKISRWD